LASDGPREHIRGEHIAVDSIRNFMLDSITWECDVKTLFREENLGCKQAVSSAISWFFRYESEGIILEDDCLPDMTFFGFCSRLLKDYRDDSSIGMIAGTSYLFNEVVSSDDYFFSKYHAVWGWATWRDRWHLYGADMNLSYKSRVNQAIENFIDWDSYVAHFYMRAYEKTISGQIDAWGYQWIFTCMLNDLYSLTPYKNLVKNLGFEGTRSDQDSPFLDMKTLPITRSSTLKSTSLADSLSVDRRVFFNVFYRFSKWRALKVFLGFVFSTKKKIFGGQWLRF
jgi:hypothetical protein